LRDATIFKKEFPELKRSSMRIIGTSLTSHSILFQSPVSFRSFLTIKAFTGVHLLSHSRVIAERRGITPTSKPHT